MFVGVYPGEEAGDVVQFGELYNCLLDLNLGAGDEFALVYAVVDLLIKGALGVDGGLIAAVPVKYTVEVRLHFRIEAFYAVANVVVVVVEA